MPLGFRESKTQKLNEQAAEGITALGVSAELGDNLTQVAGANDVRIGDVLLGFADVATVFFFF